LSLKIREYMITKIIHEEKIQKAKKYVEKGESFVIVTHVTPDGDAIGSALGLYHFLTAYGKDNVTVVVPNDFPQFYKWMPGHKEIVIHEKYPDFAEQLIRDADVLFCLDFNEPGVLAMANAGPNTGSSQFFVTVVPTPWLQNHHSIFGKVVEKISHVKTDFRDKPLEDVVVETIQIVEK